MISLSSQILLLAQAFFFLKMTTKKGIGICLRPSWGIGNTVTDSEMFL